jgi:hypothetical protein
MTQFPDIYFSKKGHKFEVYFLDREIVYLV